MMNEQALVEPPIYNSGYPQIPDQSCMNEHLGHPAANHDSFAAAGSIGHPHALMSTNRNSIRYMTHHRPGPPDSNQYGNISESGSGSISTSPSSSGSDQHLLSPLNSTSHNPFPTSQIVPVGSYHQPHYNGLPPHRMASMTDPPGPGMLNHAAAGRSPAGNNPGSPSLITAARENYTTHTPHIGRHALSPRSNPEVRTTYAALTETPRSVNSYTIPYSSASAGPGLFGSHPSMLPQSYSTPANSENASPPFGQQQNFDKQYTILTDSGQRVIPSINAKIEKGFFRAGDTWTCYRRNYFAVQCSYSFDIYLPMGTYYLQRPKKENVQIQAIAMSLSAVVDGSGGKAIELIQHTPKRDKGPQNPIQKEKLVPLPPGKMHDHRSFSTMGYTPNSAFSPPNLPFQTDDSPSYSNQAHQTPNTSNQPHSSHIFERVQFKSATANNGKRRAQQQYYHLVVELWVDIRTRRDAHPEWHKVAQKESEPMVVRGRSPSHYSNDSNHPGTPRGPAPPGTGGNGHHGFGPSAARYSGSTLGGSLPFGSSSGLPGSYRPHQLSLDPSPIGSHSVSSASSMSGGMDSIMKDEDGKPMEGGFDGSYTYYPGPLYDSGMAPPGSKHSNGPSTPNEDLRRIKEEHGGAHHGMTSSWVGRCGGHFQAAETSRGLYHLPHEYNTTGY